MHLKRLQLQNVGKHAAFETTFKQGIIDLGGPNGSGKSTIVSSIFAALTNDFGRFPDGLKERAIRDLAKGEKSFIKLDFEHDGESFQVIRNLEPNGSSLKIGKGKVITSAKEIDAKLTKILGYPRQVLDHLIIVEQWQLFQFISMSDAERANLFQILCGTTRAKKLWEALGKRIESAQSLLTEITDNRDELRNECRQIKQEYDVRLAELRRLKPQLLGKKGRTQIEKILRAAEERSRIDIPARVSNSTATNDRYATLLAQESQLQQTVKRLQARVDSGAEDVAGYRATLQSNKEEVARQTRRQQYLDAIKQAKASKLPAKIDTPNLDAVHDADSRRSVTRERISQLEAILAALACPEGGPTTTCPTCGSDVRDKVDRFRKDLKAEKLAMESIRLQCAKFDLELKGASLYEKAVADRDKKIRLAEAALSEIPEVATLDDHACLELVNSIQGFQRLEGELQDARERLASTSASQAAANKRRKEVKADLDAQVARDTELQKIIGKHDCPKLEARLERDRQRQDRVSGQAGQLVQLKKRHQAAAASLAKEKERVANLKKRQAKAVIWIDRMRQAREQFHHTGIPMLVANEYLGQMEESLNATLEMFGSPFTAAPADNLSLDIQFPGCPTRSANWLSGGQMMVLAVAFHFAANRSGLMILDEPTVGLDAENRKYLKQAMLNFQRRVRANGQQVIIVTHDLEFREAFDQSIQLGD